MTIRKTNQLQQVLHFICEYMKLIKLNKVSIKVQEALLLQDKILKVNRTKFQGQIFAKKHAIIAIKK